MVEPGKVFVNYTVHLKVLYTNKKFEKIRRFLNEFLQLNQVRLNEILYCIFETSPV